MLKIGKLEKIQITAFTNSDRTGIGKTLKFEVNPTQVSSRHENQFSHLRGINTSGRSAPYSKTHSDLFSIQLIVDDTITSNSIGVIAGLTPTKVTNKVQNFLTFCAYMDGDIHEPRFLRLQWGTINFDCRLQSVEIKYTRFDDQGNPIRAELDTVFISDMPDKKRIRLENKKSPDITHTIRVRKGDTLTGLCKKVYGDPDLYLTIAKVNQINHFRKLTSGQELTFPPLEK